jgi:hypothetical protein
MGYHRFGNERVRCIVTVANIYEYKSYLLELHPGSEPLPLRKDLEPAKRVRKGFYDIVAEFCNLPKKEQKKYLIYS